MEAGQPPAPYRKPTATTPTQPSPIEGEGYLIQSLVRCMTGVGRVRMISRIRRQNPGA